MHARYSFELNWIDYLADTWSMKHKSDLFTLLQLDSICYHINHNKHKYPNAQHVTININRLIILILLDNHC